MDMDETLKRIDYNQEALLKMLGDDKMTDSYDSGLLAGMLQNKGIDPGVLALMKDDSGFGGNNGLLLVLFLLLLGGGQGFGWGGKGDVAKESTVINQGNYQSLMTAVSSSGERQERAISDLAVSLGASVGDVKLALAGLDSHIGTLGYDLSSKLSDCCCRTNLNIERSQNAIQNQISAQTLNLNNFMSAQNLDRERQTNQILGAIAGQTTLMQQGFCDIKERELQHQIEELKGKVLEQSQSAQTAQILSAVNASKNVAGVLNTTAGTWSGSTS